MSRPTAGGSSGAALGGGSFAISVDHDRDLVRATLAGFFSVAEVERFALAEQAAVASLQCAPNQHRVLIDASRGEIHSQEVASAFAHIVGASPLRARRIAVVASGTLHRMQTRRIVSEGHGAMFATIADAEAWLAEDEAATRGAHLSS